MERFHSKNRPRVKALRKVKNLITPTNLKRVRLVIPGNKITSSKSKIKKINVIIKNRIENGSRPSAKVLNPHSKGERNSRI